MGDAVVASTARTAIGTAFKGSLLDVDAFELGTKAVAEAVRRSGVDPALVDDVVLGESLYGGGESSAPCISPNIFAVPGRAAKSSISSFNRTPVPLIVTRDP